MTASAPIPGFEGTAAYLIAFILMLKGYNVRGVMSLDMPANMISVHSGLNEEDSRIIINQAKEKVDSFINSILNGDKEFSGISALLYPTIFKIHGNLPLFSGKAVLCLGKMHRLQALCQKLPE